MLGGLLGGVSAAHGQAFVDAKTALVDYTQAKRVPWRSCEAMRGYRAQELVAIHAQAMGVRLGDAVRDGRAWGVRRPSGSMPGLAAYTRA